MFAQQYRHIAHKWDVSYYTSDNLLLTVKVELVARVELGVISIVVVTFGEKVKRSFPTSH